MASLSLFDELGGEPALRRIVSDFVDRVFDDAMIGFMFRKASRERVKEKEYEFAAAHLGGRVVYTGRPIGAVHAPHAIQGGQFNRRLQILKETLHDCGAPARVSEHWLRHTEGLRQVVTRGLGNACDPTLGGGGAP